MPRWPAPPRGCAAAFPAARDAACTAISTRRCSCRNRARPQKKLGFFPGSTIGNLTRDEAPRFPEVHAAGCSGANGAFVVGVDLKKDSSILLPAYNDRLGRDRGVQPQPARTRSIASCGGTFDLDRFAHEAIYNETDGRIEMHMRSLATQRASKCWTRAFAFAEGETIHTENSHKYTVDGVSGAGAFRRVVAPPGLDRQGGRCSACTI